MIRQKTILRVSDNSGAKKVKCIKVLGGFKRQYAKLGDIIVVTIIELRNKSKKTSKVKKKEIYKALIVRTKLENKKKTGMRQKFVRNRAVLINKHGNPIGTRIIGPLPKFLKKEFRKFTNIAASVV